MGCLTKYCLDKLLLSGWHIASGHGTQRSQQLRFIDIDDEIITWLVLKRKRRLLSGIVNKDVVLRCFYEVAYLKLDTGLGRNQQLTHRRITETYTYPACAELPSTLAAQASFPVRRNMYTPAHVPFTPTSPRPVVQQSFRGSAATHIGSLVEQTAAATASVGEILLVREDDCVFNPWVCYFSCLCYVGSFKSVTI